MVGVFVRLKLTLLRNQLGRRSQQVVGLALLLAMVVLGAGALALTVALSNGGPAVTADLAAVMSLAVTGGWALLPVASTGIDSTLDVGRLASWPLTPRRHGPGLFAAAWVGAGPLASLLVLAGFPFRARSGPAALVAAAAVVGQVAIGILLGRVVVSSLGELLRRRRARELAYSITALATMAVSIGMQVLSRRGGGIDRDTLATIGRVGRLVPLNLAGRALSLALAGHLASALASLVGAAAVVAGLMALWWRLIARELTSSAGDATAAPRARRRMRATRPVTVAAARELRYLWRHPVARTNLMTALLLAGIGAVPLSRTAQRPGGVLVAAAVVGTIGLSAMNMLAVDGRALWSDLLATDLATVLRGKVLARAVVATPVVTLVAVGLAVAGGGWAYLAGVAPLAGGVFGVTMGVGAFASVVAPVPAPDATAGAPWSSSPGRGCVTGLAALGLFMVSGLACVPLAAGAVAGVLAGPAVLVGVLVLAPLYGWAAWRAGLAAALRRAAGRVPELLAAVEG